MSGNKKSDSKIRTIQMTFIVIGLVAIIIEAVYLVGSIKSNGISDNKNTETIAVQTVSSEKNSSTEAKTTKKREEQVTVDKYVFVGDSRYVGMSIYAESNDKFISKNNMGYNYLEEQMNLIKQSCDSNTALVIGLGVNDIKYSSDKYIAKINEMASTLDCHIYYMLVNPVDEKKEVNYGYNVENAKIDEFNKKMKENLSDKVRIIDTNSYLVSKGYVTVDGLHYDNDTYKLIYDYIKESIND